MVCYTKVILYDVKNGSINVMNVVIRIEIWDASHIIATDMSS